MQICSLELQQSRIPRKVFTLLSETTKKQEKIYGTMILTCGTDDRISRQCYWNYSIRSRNQSEDSDMKGKKTKLNF